MERYQIVRFFEKGGRRVIEKGLDLEQAQEHCNDSDSSSRTCTKWSGRKRTETRGPWFDGYEKE